MTDKGTIKPWVSNQALFDFKRYKYEALFSIDTDGVWHPSPYPFPEALEWTTDEGQNAEDNSPSATNHIYQIDCPGWPELLDGTFKQLLQRVDFKDWVEISFDGQTWYQCSDFLKWKSQINLKWINDNGPQLTRKELFDQILDSEWMNIEE